MSELSPHGPPVAESEDLYRAILTPLHWSDRDHRPSSAAFDHPVFSVDVASRTTPAAMAARFQSVARLVSFNCGVARSIGFDTRDERDEQFPGNAAHAHVYFVGAAKRKTKARELAGKCRIVDVA